MIFAEHQFDGVLSPEGIDELGEIQAAALKRTGNIRPIGHHFPRHLIAGKVLVQEKLFFLHQQLHSRIDLIVAMSLSPHFFCGTPCTIPRA